MLVLCREFIRFMNKQEESNQGVSPKGVRSGITEGPILRSINRLAAPMVAAAILSNLQSVINLFWVGRLGSDAVASVAIAGTILMILFPLLMGLSTGTVALVARAAGSQRWNDAGEAASQSILLSAALGLATAGIGWYYSSALFRLLGAEPAVIAHGVGYLRVFLLGSFTGFILFTGNAALQGAGDTVRPMYLMALSNILNILLDPVFIFGLGPFPRMGVSGAALASVLSQTIAAVAAIHLLFSGKTPLALQFSQWKPNLSLSWRLLRIGIPGSGMMFSRSLMSAVLMRVVADHGTAAVAAYGTGLRFHMLILMPAFAIGGAAATMVGQNLGAGKPQRAHKAAWLATGIDSLIMVLSALVLMFFAAPLIRLFNSDPQVVAIGAQYLVIVSPFYVFAAIGIVLSRALNGAGDTMAPMFITILTLWGLQVPLAVGLSKLWYPATYGIWWAIAAAMVVNGLLTAAWFQTGRWRHKKV